MNLIILTVHPFHIIKTDNSNILRTVKIHKVTRKSSFVFHAKKVTECKLFLEGFSNKEKIVIDKEEIH